MGGVGGGRRGMEWYGGAGDGWGMLGGEDGDGRGMGGMLRVGGGPEEYAVFSK